MRSQPDAIIESMFLEIVEPWKSPWQLFLQVVETYLYLCNPGRFQAVIRRLVFEGAVPGVDSEIVKAGSGPIFKLVLYRARTWPTPCGRVPYCHSHDLRESCGTRRFTSLEARITGPGSCRACECVADPLPYVLTGSVKSR